jgi:hypothetical protein
MAREIIEITNVVAQKSVGFLPDFFNITDGMMFMNDGSCLLFVHNAGDEPVQVTIIAVPDEAGRAVNYVKVIPNEDMEIFGPFLPSWWNQSYLNSGYIYVDFAWPGTPGDDVYVGVINY